MCIRDRVCAVIKKMLDQEKLSGKTSVKQLLKSGGDLQVFKFQTEDLATVKKMADKYGILYSILPDLNKSDGMSEILFHSDVYKRQAGRGILDGEVVVMKNGVPDFYELQRRTLLTDPFKIALAAERFPASFVAYDCLFCGEEELLDMPLMQRKEKLAALFLRETPRFAFSRFIEGRGTSLYQLCDCLLYTSRCV